MIRASGAAALPGLQWMTMLACAIVADRWHAERAAERRRRQQLLLRQQHSRRKTRTLLWIW